MSSPNAASAAASAGAGTLTGEPFLLPLTVFVETHEGTSQLYAAEAMIRLAKQLDCVVKTMFCGVPWYVTPKHSVEEAIREFEDRCEAIPLRAHGGQTGGWCNG